MINYLKGKLVIKEPTYIVIEVNGVGYEVHISLGTFSELKDKEDVTILTYLHIKEDSHTLFGFVKDSEKKMFLQLLSINGVGPSTGLMIQSSLTAGELRQAILSDDVSTIQGVKGIGAKTAQRIILELKDKILKIDDQGEGDLFPQPHNTLRQEALSALVTLGINKGAAEKSIERIIRQSGSAVSLEDLIKQVLKNV